jgi:hypothetical protein
MLPIFQAPSGAAYPPGLLSVSSKPRGWIWPSDPAGIATAHLAAGDTWFNLGVGSSGIAAIIAGAGVRPGVSLASFVQNSGDMIIDKNASTVPSIVSSGSGTTASPWVISNFDISLPVGRILFRSGVILFDNCNIHCAYAPTGTTAPLGIITSTSTGVPSDWDQATFRHCTIQMDVPHPLANGFVGHGLSFENCDIFHVGDCGGPQAATGQTGAYIRMEGCYAHDHSYFMGMYAPASPDYSSLSNGGIVVNAGGDPNKPDGGHNDGLQPQGGAFGLINNCFLDGFNDTTVDAFGVMKWVRKSMNDLTTAAGNGYSVYGTDSTSASVQMNQNQPTAPTTDWTFTNDFYRGGRFAVFNLAYGPYARIVLKNGTWLEGRPGSGTFGGATTPPWTSTGPGGFKSDGTPKVGSMAKSWSPGYPISLGTSGSSTIDISQIDYGGNVDWLGNPIPWRNTSSTVIRLG